MDHPLGCHRPRIPDYVVFEKLAQVLVFGYADWRNAYSSGLASTLRRGRDEWIEAGMMEAMKKTGARSLRPGYRPRAH